MKLTLIFPKWETGLWSMKFFRMAPLSLPLLASLTPEDFELKIIDENIEKISYEETDAVGISVMTPLANRAYKIADNYRRKDVKVILGGIHPSILPNEAVKHADSVIIGEVEGIWSNVMDDLRKNNLKKIYKVESRPDILNLPFLRRNLLKKEKYFFSNLVQTSRGCPFGCDFCSVSKFNGRKVRHRSIESVIEEIKEIRNTKLLKKIILFADDNIVGDFSYAEELFKKLTSLNIEWGSQCSLKIAKNENLLKLAAESGCKALFIGFESLNQTALNEVHKSYNTREYKELIKKIHDYGIMIEGAFIFGFDSDKKDVFNKTVDFCYENDLEFAQFTILTPFPDTELFNRLQEEKRILTYNWNLYDAAHVVFKPRNMSPEELRNGLMTSYENFYSTKSILKRTFSRAFKLKHYLFFMIMRNLEFKQIVI